MKNVTHSDTPNTAALTHHERGPDADEPDDELEHLLPRGGAACAIERSLRCGARVPTGIIAPMANPREEPSHAAHANIAPANTHFSRFSAQSPRITPVTHVNRRNARRSSRSSR